MEGRDFLGNEGPFTYANWKAMEAGFPSKSAAEFLMYTDAHITGHIEDGYGPYQLLNAIAHSEQPRLKPSIVLRIENHLPSDLATDPEMKTDYKRYHGGDLTDEIAALVSLCLGIRIESGFCTRVFEPGGDVRGRPVAWDGFDPPMQPPIGRRPILPYALGSHSLSDVTPLLTLTRLTPAEAVDLVRAARLFQDAMWIAESQPELAWVMFVSAIEVAAGQWRSAQDPPLDRLRASRPALEELLKPYGDELVQKVAEQIADYMGATKKFVDFLLHFLPPPPEQRPDAFCQHSWTVQEFKKTFQLIYRYRSQALHSGTPFPAPMCHSFNYRLDGVYPEKPLGLATQTRGGVWNVKDTPILLTLFEYIVRKSLLLWWQDMVNLNTGDKMDEETRMRPFQDDDEGYSSWLASNPQGFVVNCHRNPTPAYLVLHRATCFHIQQREGRTMTTGQYRKVCSGNEQDLHYWAATLSGTLTRCRSCQP